MKTSPETEEVRRKAARVQRARVKQAALWRHLAHVGALGWTLMVPLVLGLLGGQLVGRLTSSRAPILLGLLVGLVAGIAATARQVRGALQDDEEDRP